MGDRIIVQGAAAGGFVASVEGIATAGTGETEAQAIRSLAGLLADFVDGHAARIRELEAAQPAAPAVVP